MDCQEDGHYPAHMFVTMVIHFLQQRQVVPVLHEVSLHYSVDPPTGCYHYVIFIQLFSDLLEQMDQSGPDVAFVTPEVVQKLSYGIKDWRSSNSETLGQLWLGLLRCVGLKGVEQDRTMHGGGLN